MGKEIVKKAEIGGCVFKIGDCGLCICVSSILWLKGAEGLGAGPLQP